MLLMRFWHSGFVYNGFYFVNISIIIKWLKFWQHSKEYSRDGITNYVYGLSYRGPIIEVDEDWLFKNNNRERQQKTNQQNRSLSAPSFLTKCSHTISINTDSFTTSLRPGYGFSVIYTQTFCFDLGKRGRKQQNSLFGVIIPSITHVRGTKGKNKKHNFLSWIFKLFFLVSHQFTWAPN